MWDFPTFKEREFMARIKRQDIVIGQDTQEQHPYDFKPYEKYGITVEKVNMPYGDYTLLYPDLSRDLTIERKSIDDFVKCCSHDRARFERELMALRGFKYAYVAGEFSMLDVERHLYRSKTRTNSVLGSITTWQCCWHVGFLFLETRELAAYCIASFFRFLAEHETGLAKSHCMKFSEPLPVPEGLCKDKVISMPEGKEKVPIISGEEPSYFSPSYFIPGETPW